MIENRDDLQGRIISQTLKSIIIFMNIPRYLRVVCGLAINHGTNQFRNVCMDNRPRYVYRQYIGK